VPDEASAPFWEAAAQGVLVLARCSRCQTFVHPPEPVCPHCHHTDPDLRFEPVPARGVIRSWTVIRQSFLPGFDVPFVLADVALDIDGQDDLRMIGRLLDGPDAPLHVGDHVEIGFEHLDDGAAVPAFSLTAS
jgi:uncharacterized OB-fold protein